MKRVVEHDLLDEVLVTIESLRGLLTHDVYTNKVKPLEQKIRFFLIDERIKEFNLRRVEYYEARKKKIEDEETDTVPQRYYDAINSDFGKFED